MLRACSDESGLQLPHSSSESVPASSACRPPCWSSHEYMQFQVPSTTGPVCRQAVFAMAGKYVQTVEPWKAATKPAALSFHCMSSCYDKCHHRHGSSGVATKNRYGFGSDAHCFLKWNGTPPGLLQHVLVPFSLHILVAARGETQSCLRKP